MRTDFLLTSQRKDMSNEQILKEEFEKLRFDMIRKHEDLGMKASGRWIEGTQTIVRNTTASLVGEHYTEYLVDGRPPSTKTPPVEAIKQWIDDKGIQPERGTISSLAWAIAKKIQREGTEYYKEGGTDLVSAIITPERIQRIVDRVTEFNIEGFYSDLKEVFKEPINA